MSQINESKSETSEPKSETSEAQFRVIALTASLPSYQQCSIVSENNVIPAIFSNVYGPASEADCRAWKTSNCGK